MARWPAREWQSTDVSRKSLDYDMKSVQRRDR